MTLRSAADVAALRDEHKLADVVKDEGATVTQSFIMAQLVRMNANLHLPNGLTDDNIRDIAVRLTTDPEIVYWLTIPDVCVLLRRIEDGEYMRFNNRFGKDDFYACLARYCSERREAHTETNRNEAAEARLMLRTADIGYYVGDDGRLHISERRQEDIAREEERLKAEAEEKRRRARALLVEYEMKQQAQAQTQNGNDHHE